MSVDITQGYPIGTCSQGQPLLAIAGGTGTYNIGSLAFSGAVVLTPNVSGPQVLTIAAVSGASSPTIVIPTLVSAVGTSVNNVISIIMTISFTATASTAVLNIGIPAALTNAFVNGGQANGVANVTSGTGGGTLVSLASASSSRNITVTLALGGNSGTYTANLSFGFLIN